MSDLFPRGSLVIVSASAFAPATVGIYRGATADGERHKVALLDKRVRYVRAGRLHRPMVWRPAGGYLKVARFAESVDEIDTQPKGWWEGA